MNRIIITSCSQKKKLSRNLLPAIERYDGPSFRLLRKYLKISSDRLDIYICSAKFGLLLAETKIPFYDQRLTNKNQTNLSKISKKQVEEIFVKQNQKQEIFVNLGNLYLKAFMPALEKISENNLLIFSAGSSGKRLSELHNWLYGNSSQFLQSQPEIKPEKEILIKGIRLSTNEAQIRKIVKKEISQNGINELQKFQSWFVPIDDIKVSPKWIITRLTGLPASKFHSDQARKALQRLGIKVNRV